MKELREYQSNLINLIRQAFVNGYRRVLLQAATGSGKSIIFAKIIQMACTKRKKVLFLVHRRELILQASKHLYDEDVEHGIIMSKVPPSFMGFIQLASIQTLWARCHVHKKIPFPEADIIVIDEAHTAGSKTYVEIMKLYPKALILGVTATPVRKGGLGLGDCFDYLIMGPSVRWLMDKGYLAEAEYMIPFSPNLSKVKSLGGDWVDMELSLIMNEKKLIGDQVGHFKKYANDKKAIIFAADVAHSQAMLEKFHESGYRIAHVDGKTDENTRRNIFRDFELGKLQLITNVGIAVEGIDIPDIECMIDVAPTKSIGRYLQKGGRILRPKVNNAKAIVIDHAGNWWRHGALDQVHDWNLNTHEKIQDREKRKDKQKEGSDKKKEFKCPGCGYVFSGQNICPKCGTKLNATVMDIESCKGELVKSEKSKNKEVSFNDMDIWHGMLLKYAYDKEYKPGWVYHKFQAKFGSPPQKEFAGIQLLPDAGFKKYIQHLNIRAAKGAQKRNKL